MYIFEPKGISEVQSSNTLGQQFAELIKVVTTKDKVTLHSPQRAGNERIEGKEICCAGIIVLMEPDPHSFPQAHFVFKPNLQQQKKCDNCTGSAIDGIFTVKYDVNRDSNAGELQVSHTRPHTHPGISFKCV